ncbi:MAG TPA: sugar ABC transporter permease, partial [Caldilineaceae bacterium]|nr:sugar ABC transporter permease [Caldilineaceae bacterium]
GALLMRTVTAWWAMLGSLAHRMRRAYLFYLFVMPSLTLIVIFTYYPAVLAFNNSLTNMSLRRVTEYVGLENYVKILTIVASILKTITVPLLVAELIFWLRSNTLKYLFRTFFIFPAVVPGLITILLWRMIYAPNIGLINQILRAVGLTQFETAWLGDERTALLAIVGAGFPFVNIFALLIYLGGLIDINPELFDASAIDGAGRWARFWRIDVPLLGQQFRLLLFFTFSGAIQGFASIWVFTRGGPGYATYTPALQMYRQLIDTEYGYGSAIGVLLFLMSFGVTLMLLRFRRATFV